jgi:hypothetical protein
LADQFRSDVHQATATVEHAGPWTAGPTCLVLRQADGGHIVYHWTKDRLERTEWPGGATQPLPLGAETATIEFASPEAAGRLVKLRLVQPASRIAPPRVREIMAALGGEQ